MPSATRDPANYRAMSVPHANFTEGSAALDAFFEDMKASRIKHRIADVSLCASVNYTTVDGDETAAITSGHMGDSLKGTQLAAYALAQARDDMNQKIDSILAHKKKR